MQQYGNKRKREVQSQQELAIKIKDGVHNPDTARSRLIGYEKRSEDPSASASEGFIKKTVVPFPRLG